MCPFHHFVSSPACRYCMAYVGGFYGGFFWAPSRWKTGYQRIKSQKGLILASEGTSEEEENRFLGQEIRAVYRLHDEYNTKENRESAREGWNQLPTETRIRLKESGFEALGNFTGGLFASQVVLFGLNHLMGRLSMLHLRLRPLMVIRTPTNIAAGFILSAFSFQASAAILIQRQRQIYTQYPGTEAIHKQILDKLTKDRDKDKDGTK